MKFKNWVVAEVAVVVPRRGALKELIRAVRTSVSRVSSAHWLRNRTRDSSNRAKKKNQGPKNKGSLKRAMLLPITKPPKGNFPLRKPVILEIAKAVAAGVDYRRP